MLFIYNCSASEVLNFPLAIGGPSGWLTPFECCSPTMFVHLQVAFHQKLTAVGLVECLPCPGSSVSHFQWCWRAQPQVWLFFLWVSSQKFAFCCCNEKNEFEQSFKERRCRRWRYCSLIKWLIVSLKLTNQLFTKVVKFWEFLEMMACSSLTIVTSRTEI